MSRSGGPAGLSSAKARTKRSKLGNVEVTMELILRLVDRMQAVLGIEQVNRNEVISSKYGATNASIQQRGNGSDSDQAET